jgi:hypothetical protein
VNRALRRASVVAAAIVITFMAVLAIVVTAFGLQHWW